MRRRVADFLKVLNRAQPEQEEKGKRQPLEGHSPELCNNLNGPWYKPHLLWLWVECCSSP